jgi:hypothetical protein
MKTMTRKFLVAGLIAGALTFVGCKSDSSAERTPPPAGTMQTPPPPDTTPGPGTQSRPPPAGTETNPGTGGSGTISTTKQSDDNLRMPEDDPLRLKTGDKNVRDAESEQGVHENSAVSPEPGTGGSGFNRDAIDNSLNEGGNVDDTVKDPQAPLDRQVPYNPLRPDSQIPEGSR